MIAALLVLVACDDAITEVTMSGIVQDAPANAGEVVSGAALITRDRDGDVIGEDQSAADGSFAVAVPAGESFYLAVSGEGYVSTAFSAWAGLADFEASTGYPWLATPEWVEAERARWAGCENALDGEGAERAGGLVTGQALVVLSDIADYTVWPPLPDASVVAHASDGADYPACYLDDDGAALADGTATGSTGEYAIFGIPDGAVLVELSATRSNGEVGIDVYEFVAVDDGLVPVFPTPVEL